MGPHIPAMERIPEPELMLGSAQAAAYAAADFSASDGAVVARLLELFPEGLGPRLIDLGCGPGNISFLLADLQPAPPLVLGIDGSAPMLALAEAELRRRSSASARASMGADPSIPSTRGGAGCRSASRKLMLPGPQPRSISRGPRPSGNSSSSRATTAPSLALKSAAA